MVEQAAAAVVQTSQRKEDDEKASSLVVMEQEEEEEEDTNSSSSCENNRDCQEEQQQQTEQTSSSSSSLPNDKCTSNAACSSDEPASSSSSSSSSSSTYYTRNDLKCLDILEHPVWVFDIENKSMWWANTSAALSLWNSPTRQALLERNFAHDMSEATERRLQDYLRRFDEKNEKIHESWTFFPNGEGPVTVNVTCSGVRIRDDDNDDDVDDSDHGNTNNTVTSGSLLQSPRKKKNKNGSNQRLAMLVEGDTPKTEAEIDKTALRGVEMLRHLPVPVCQFDGQGKVMYQNPEAAHVFGGVGVVATTTNTTTTGDDEKNNGEKHDCKENERHENDNENQQSSSSVGSCDFLQRFENKELGRRILKTVLQDGRDFQDEVLQYARTTTTCTTTSPSSTRGDDATSSTNTTTATDETKSTIRSSQTTTTTTLTPRWFSVKCRRSKDPVTAEPVLLYSARDLTDLKKADALCLAKNEFVATMAHEIRTPLHQVLGFLELLSTTKHQMTSFQVENVLYMENSAQSLSTVVNDILDYSKLEIGHMKLECIPFEMSTAVLTSIAAIRSKAQAKSIQIRHVFKHSNNNQTPVNNKDDDNTISVSSSDNGNNDKSDNDDNDTTAIPRVVVGDPNRIRQILLNLLQNSVKFTPEHGHISISVTRINDNGNSACCFTDNSNNRNGAEKEEGVDIPSSNQYDEASAGTTAADKNKNMSSSNNADTACKDDDGYSTAVSSFSSSTADADANSTRQEEVRLRFEVVDTGIGIHPDRLEDIFNKYQQADTSIARKYGGTGLGLSICKRLVAAMNGSIGVTSPGLGHGCTFWMEIPFQAVPESSSLSSSSPLPSLSPMACTAKVTPPTTVLSACIKATSSSCHGRTEATAANQDNRGSRGGGLHVLVAEDNTSNQKLAKAMLKRLGHTVVIAENGAKAIEAVEKAAAAAAAGGGGTCAVAGAPGEEEQEDARPFHVVLMDVQMPVMDGLEATRQLRRRGFTLSKLAIIGLTADYQPSERQKYLDVGMNDCLGKPTRMNELRSFLVKAMLQQELEASVANISKEMADPI